MKLVPGSVGRVGFAPAKALWLWVNLSGALVALTLGLPTFAETFGLGALTFLTLCVGHSVGLHRGLIHGTFEMSARVRHTLVTLFALTGLGGPLSWIRLHHVRDHWQCQGDCPPYFAYGHGLARDFWWNLHLGFRPTSWEPYALCARWERDPYLRFVERGWWAFGVAFFVLVGLFLGWHTALILGPLRVAGSLLGHWFIGYWTHTHGPQAFAIPGARESGTNSRGLGWISFGEGFHNNHHALPDSARMGVVRGEFDLGWCVVQLLEQLGLVHKVKSWCRGNVDVRGYVLGATHPCPKSSVSGVGHPLLP